MPALCDRFFLVLICLQLMLAFSCLPKLSCLPFCLSLLLYSLLRSVIFEAALTTLLFLYAIGFSLGKGRPRDVVCQLLFLVWHFPGILPVHCRFTRLLAPRTPLNREGALVLRLRARCIPSHVGLDSPMNLRMGIINPFS